MAKINAMIKSLQDTLQAKTNEKEFLVNQIKDCEIQLDRAKKLTDGLQDENKRWNEEIKTLKLTLEL